MKIIYALLLSALFLGCVAEAGTNNTVLGEPEKLDNLQPYLAEGVYLESKRPRNDILSEQEIMLKAADYAVKEGVLDPEFYLYKDDPTLMSAKIEAPILIYGPDGLPMSYMITAVDKAGAVIMRVWVAPELDAKEENFEIIKTVPNPNKEDRTRWHFITKRELKQFIETRFPDKQASEPIAIVGLRLEDSILSSMQTFWYFSVEENERSAEILNEEYLLDASVFPYKPLEEGNNRAVIGDNYEGSLHLKRYRMVRLTTPLNLITDTTERSINGSTGNILPTEPLKFEGVPLE